jgi:hypothetical protein
MKTQTQYQPHNADDLGEGWDAVAEYAEYAHLAAFDGCHKIYLAMDEEQANWFRANYNGTNCDDRTVEVDTEDLATVVREWWAESCGLRFVNAVFTNVANPNAGYVSLISQCADESDDDDEDDEATMEMFYDEIADRLNDKDEVC